MRKNIVLFGAALCLSLPNPNSVHAVTNIWSGAAGNRLWSDGGNWSGGAPASTTDAVFGATNTTGTVGPAGVSNNVVDTSVAIQSLAYTNSSGFHHTRIEAGMTLSIANSGSANVLQVGASTTNVNQTIYSTISGPGTLAINNSTNATILVSQRFNVGSPSGGHLATLDLSGLDVFLASVRELNLAANGVGTPNNSPMGRLYLARTNSITCNGANGILMGTGSQNSGTNLLILGQQNSINTESFIVGGYKCGNSFLKYSAAWPGSSLVLRNRTGTGPATKWSVAENGSGNTGSACNGTADFTGGSLDAQVVTLYVARSYNLASQTGVGLSTGTFTYDSGSIVARTVEIGYQSQVSNGRATGTLNVGSNATLLVSNDLRLARFVGAQDTSGAFANGTLNIRGGTVNVMGNLVDGGGSSTVLITNNGNLNLQPTDDPALGDVSVDTLTLASGAIRNVNNLSASNLTLNGSIQNVANITVSNLTGQGSVQDLSGLFTVAENGRVIIGINGGAATLSIGGSLSINNSNTVMFDLASETTEGGGTNDLIVVNGNLSLSGTISVPISFLGTPPVTPATYVLIRYTGTLTGGAANLNASGPRYTFTFDDTTPGEIRLTVSGSGEAGNLEWYPATSAPTWDVNAELAWVNLNTLALDRFYQLDRVTFADIGDFAPVVSIVGAVRPSAVVVQPIAVDYTFAGPGSLSGPATLTKRGDTTLTISNANDYTGVTTIESGAIKAGSATALGGTNAGTTIESGAILDLNGQNLGFEAITARGAGPAGAGAIVNSQPGTGFVPGLKKVILADNTTFGGDGRWDIRDSAGGLAGNGFTLTKAGTNNMSLKDLGETGLGDISLNSGLVYFEGNTTLGLPDRALNVAAGATFGFYNTGTNRLNKVLNLNGGSVSNGAGNNAFFGPVSFAAPAYFDFASGAITLFGPVTGGYGLTKGGSGTLVLAGTNNFASTLLTNGTLGLSNNLALGSAHNITVVSTIGGTGLSGSRVTLWGNITMPPGVSVSLPSDTNGGLRSTMYSDGPGLNEWQGPITLNGNNIINFAATTNAPLKLSGPVTGNGFTGVMFMRGSAGASGVVSSSVNMSRGTFAVTDNTGWTLNSVNNAWSVTSIAYGSVKLGASDALPITSTLSMGQASSSDGGTLDLAGFNQTVAAMLVAGAGPRQRISNSSTNADSTFTFNGTNVSTFAGIFTDAIGGGTRKLGLTVAGGGLNLWSTNLHTGPTIIAGGTLSLGVTGAVASTALIDVRSGATFDVSAVPGFTLNAGQTLKGNGVVTGAVTVAANATLSPGASLGQLAIQGALTLAGETIMELNKNGGVTHADLVSGLSSVNYGGTLIVLLSGEALAAGDTFKLFDAPIYNGAFATNNLPALSGLQWDATQLSVDGTLRVVAGPVEGPKLSFQLGAGTGGQSQFELSWPGASGYTLQSQTNDVAHGIGTNWWDVTGLTSNRLILSPAPTDQNLFFRLIKR